MASDTLARMRFTRAVGCTGAAAGIALGAGVAGLASKGRDAASRHDERLDELQVPPDIDREHRVETADGGGIYVAEFGDPTAPPVMLLHGVTLQWRFWSAVIRLLSEHHRVLAVETRGHGRSTPGSDGVTLSHAARDVVTVIDELDCGPVVIAGHSMGGMILGTLVAEHPERVDELVSGLVFVGSSGGPTTSPAPLLTLARVQAPATALLSQLINGPLPTPQWGDNDVARGLAGLAFGPAATATMTEDLRRMQAEMDATVTAASLVSIAEYDVHDDLRALGARRPDLPVAIVVGDVDRLTPPVCARDLARSFPDPVLRHLDGIGHQVPQEAPFEVAEAVATVARRAAAAVPSQPADPVPGS